MEDVYADRYAFAYTGLLVRSRVVSEDKRVSEEANAQSHTTRTSEFRRRQRGNRTQKSAGKTGFGGGRRRCVATATTPPPRCAAWAGACCRRWKWKRRQAEAASPACPPLASSPLLCLARSEARSLPLSLASSQSPASLPLSPSPPTGRHSRKAAREVQCISNASSARGLGFAGVWSAVSGQMRGRPDLPLSFPRREAASSRAPRQVKAQLDSRDSRANRGASGLNPGKYPAALWVGNRPIRPRGRQRHQARALPSPLRSAAARPPCSEGCRTGMGGIPAGGSPVSEEGARYVPASLPRRRSPCRHAG